MKVDFTKTFTYPVAVGREDKIADVLAIRAFQGEGISQENDPDKRAKRSLEMYRLYQKLASATPDTDWTPEELVLIKQVAGVLLPGLYGQVVDLIAQA